MPAMPMILGPASGLAIGAGGLIGLVLSLIGGGGSILAVPLLVYGVGVSSPHVAIGTGAVAVAINALGGLIAHARAGTVKWRCAGVFAASGIAGTFVGSTLGKAIDGQKLLALFGIVMVTVGLSMLRPRRLGEDSDVRLTRRNARYLLPRLIPIGAGVGLLSGVFGIGGGFLIVPGLMLATRMPLRNAIGTSLVAVTAFGASTAASYAASGLVDWSLAALFVAGGIVGSYLGIRAGGALAGRKGAMNFVFGAIVILVGFYVTGRGIVALG
jgi:uncharacterized membrane protein YfcA